jgi:hypothetical protein
MSSPPFVGQRAAAERGKKTSTEWSRLRLSCAFFYLTMKNYFNPQLGVHHRILNVPKHEQALLPVVVAHAL